MALQPRYTAIPTIPLVGIPEWQAQVLNALKENVELLTGTRGEPDGASAALNIARLTVAVPPAQEMTQVTAQGSGITISGSNVPVLADYVELINDVQRLANDFANLRATLEVLIVQLRN